MEAILVPILVKAGAPILKQLIEKHLGGAAGNVGNVIVDTIAGQLGVEPTPGAIASAHGKDPAAVEAAIRQVELSQDWLPYLMQATEGRDALLAREDAKGFFHNGWRPAMSWLVVFLFGWGLFALPLVNAAFKANIVAPDMNIVLQFAGIWLVIYGGGHTLKEVMKK